MMKTGAILINTARGAVVDEAALVEALESGHLGSVGLDVYENEPEIHPGLVENRRALLLPHMGTWTSETQEYMEQWCINNVKKSITEGKLRSRVPEQADLSYE
jgi:glyoxylate reductase